MENDARIDAGKFVACSLRDMEETFLSAAPVDHTVAAMALLVMTQRVGPSDTQRTSVQLTINDALTVARQQVTQDKTLIAKIARRLAADLVTYADEIEAGVAAPGVRLEDRQPQ